MRVINHELTDLIADYLQSKYADEFMADATGKFDIIYFIRGHGLARFFITVDARSVNFFRPESADSELNVSAADPTLFTYVDKYAKMYMKFHLED